MASPAGVPSPSDQHPAPPPAPEPWWARVLPGVAVLRRYERRWLRGDVLAGVTVTAYLIPQVMAYAAIAGLPPVVGLWAIIGPLTVYVLLGSSRQLSVGPESTTALMTAAAVGALMTAAGGPERYAEVAALLAIVVGLVCGLGYLARLGFLAELLSRPVLVGYLGGVAMLMIVGQLGKVTRVATDGSWVGAELLDLARHAGEIHGPTLALAAIVLVLLFALRRFAPTWPGPLIAMLLAAAAVALLSLGGDGIRTVGDVPRGLPTPRLPAIGDLDLVALLPAAVGIALVGYSDNILTARAFAAPRRERIDSNQELLALGGANVAAGLMHGFPVSSSASRTVLGDSMGSQTQLHSLVALGGVLVTMFFLGPILASFPIAALGAVVIYAAIRLVDAGEWRRIARFRRFELMIALATAAAVLGIGVLEGIGLAIALSVLDMLRRLASPHDGILGYVPGLAGMHDIDDYDDALQVPGLVVYRYDSPLFFANAENFSTRAQQAIADAPAPVEWFVLNAEAIVNIDLTAVDVLEELRAGLGEQGIVLALARVKQDLREELEAAGFVARLGDERIFPTLPTAVAAFADAYVARHGVRPENVDEGLASLRTIIEHTRRPR